MSQVAIYSAILAIRNASLAGLLIMHFVKYIMHLMTSKIDFQLISRELVRAIRGPVSQQALSKKMGFTLNQLYRWEAGHRKISWPDFVELCLVRKVPIETVLRTELGYNGSPKQSAGLIKVLKGQDSAVKLSRKTQIAPTTFSKWLNGKSAPSLAQMLSLIENTNLEMVQFIEALIRPQKLDALKTLSEEHQNLRELFYRYPEASGMQALMDTEAYMNLKSHEKGILTRAIPSTTPEEELLQMMVESGHLKKKGNRYEIGNEPFDTRGSVEGSKNMRRFWIEFALKRLAELQDFAGSDRYANFIYTVTDEGDKKMRQAMYEFISTLKTIGLEEPDQPRTQARVFNLQDILLSF